MKHPASRRLRAFLLAVALLCTVPSGAPWAATPSAEPPRGELRLNQAEGRLLHLSRPPASIFLADPSIADIATPTDKTVFIYGKKPGRTSLFALDASGAEIASWRVLVAVNDEGSCSSPVDLECAVRGMMRLDVTGMVGIQGWGDAAP